MAKNIIAIIGARKSGRTEVANLLKTFYSEYIQITAHQHAFYDFLKVQNLSREMFFYDKEYEENRSMLFSFRELNQEKYLTLFSEDLQGMNNIIVDEVYYFSELKMLIQLGAKIIYVESTDDKRKEFGLTQYMSQQFYTKEVASIKKDEVKHWKNTLVVYNNTTKENLRINLRGLI